jgi:hypothetical protein
VTFRIRVMVRIRVRVRVRVRVREENKWWSVSKRVGEQR